MAPKPLKILVAVDFSPESLEAVKKVRGLLRRVPGEMTIAHVRPDSDVRAAVVEDRGDLLRLPRGSLAQAIREYYEGRLARISRSGESVRILKGEAARELVREVRKGYDLLAMGKRGRGSAASFLLGSTVLDALQRSPVPLVVVPFR